MLFFFSKRNVFAVFILFISFSCEGPYNPDYLNSFSSTNASITGIMLTDETGPEPLGVWGELTVPESPVGNKIIRESDTYMPLYPLALYWPYPNPSNWPVNIRFDIGEDSAVSCWVTPAVFEGYNTRISNNIGNTIIQADAVSIIKYLIKDQQKYSGHHQVLWDGSDNNGNRCQSGFYRIYVQANEYTLWRDVLVILEKSGIPPGFPSYLVPYLNY